VPDVGLDGRDDHITRLYRAFLREFGLDQVSCDACARAQLPAPFNLESYSYTARGGPTWTWDVGFARWQVARRHPPARAERLAPGEVAAWLEHHSQIDQQHLAHIPEGRLEEPVLLAPAPDGQGQVLIDGSHRAAARLRAGLPVEAFLLTEEESAVAIASVPWTMHTVHQALRARGLLPDELRR
jgi:hypothetical protein